MRQLGILLLLGLSFITAFFVTASFATAQSLAGTYVFTDPESGQSLTLNVEEAPNNTFTGAFAFMGAVLQFKGEVTGPGSGTGEFLPVGNTPSEIGIFTLQLQGEQIVMSFENGGSVVTFTKQGVAPTPADNGSGEDTIITGEDDTAIDQAEVDYCKEFLADAEAVAEDPDEEAYCKDIIAASETQVSNPPAETNSPNPLNPVTPDAGGSQNPLTATADAFSGIYRGDKIALTVQLANGQYTGTLEFNGQSYPVQAAAQGDKLAGTFQASGAVFDFVFYSTDTFFTLESGGQTYNLMKQ